MIKSLPERPDDDGLKHRRWACGCNPTMWSSLKRCCQLLWGGRLRLARARRSSPPLQEAQHKINYKSMARDLAQSSTIDKMPGGLSSVAASKTKNDAWKQKENEPSNKKRKQGEEKKATPPVGRYKRGQTCSTCGGRCSHVSERRFQCNGKDKRPPSKEVTADSGKAEVAPVGATTTGT